MSGEWGKTQGLSSFYIPVCFKQNPDILPPLSLEIFSWREQYYTHLHLQQPLCHRTPSPLLRKGLWREQYCTHLNTPFTARHRPPLCCRTPSSGGRDAALILAPPSAQNILLPFGPGRLPPSPFDTGPPHCRKTIAPPLPCVVERPPPPSPLMISCLCRRGPHPALKEIIG